ncbi:MAG: response regulator transcription factor [Cyanobacteria bacterium J06633_2]
MNVANCLLQAPKRHQSVHPISCLLIDDDAKFRQGVRTLLTFYRSNPSTSFDIIGEAATIPQALQLIQTQHPMLVLLDLELSLHDGVELLSELRKRSFNGKVLVLSGHQEDEWVFRAMQSGANGYIFKSHLSVHLFEAIEAVLDDQIYLSPEVAAGFFRLFRFYSGRSQQAAHKLHLTQREQDVLHWLVQGASNDEIASNLYITVATVKAHLTAIFQKLSVTSRTQAIIKALKLGLSAA